MEKPKTVKFRKWHFLFLGSTLVLLAAFLWYWNWREIGLPNPLRPEHYVAFASYSVGMVVLGLFIFRLRKDQLTVMLVWLIIVNLVAALVTAWIYRTYPYFFEVMQTMIEAVEFDAAYIADWQRYFLTPVIYAIHSGLLLLWAESLIMFLLRNPGEEPG
jgi:hypothetical protein